MNEQVPADENDTPRTDAKVRFYVPCGYVVDADFARQLERELAAMTTLSRGAVVEAVDLRASLCREENARKVLADENERLRQRCNRLADTAMARTPV